MRRYLPFLLLIFVLALLGACSNQGTAVPSPVASQPLAAAPSDPPATSTAASIPTLPPPTSTAGPTVAPTYTPAPTVTTQPPTSTPTPTPTQPPAPSVSVKSATLNLRSGPGGNYDVVGTTKQGEMLAVTGQTMDCGWLKISTAEGGVAWISGEASYVALNVPCASVPAAPVPPTPTAAPPTPTQAAPQPTPATTSAPAGNTGGGSDLPADQGCYLFENRLGPELTVTITAQQWKWNTTFKVAADGGQHLICLSPGHFTITVDAPPPWGTLNDDLYVEAGEHYRFPIVAG